MKLTNENVEMKSNDLTGMKLHELTAPNWIDEEEYSCYYVIEKDGKFYGWQEEEYICNMIAALLGGEPDTGLVANSMAEMVDKIDECY